MTTNKNFRRSVEEDGYGERYESISAVISNLSSANYQLANCVRETSDLQMLEELTEMTEELRNEIDVLQDNLRED